MTSGDCTAIVKSIEARRSLHYAACGLWDETPIPTIESLANVGCPATWTAFLAAPREYTFVERRVPQRAGGTKYAMDQLVNPSTVVVRPSITHDHRTLLAGQIGTISADDAQSMDLYGVFRAAVRKSCSKVHEYWVGPEAELLLDSGGRLAATLKAPSAYDLKR